MSTARINRQWVLASRPEGAIKTTDFELRESATPELGEGEVLVQTAYISFEPAMSGWIRSGPSYIKPVEIGAVMRASASGTVLASRNDGFREGDEVSGMLGWQQLAAVQPRTAGLRKIPKGISLSAALSVFGITGLTAYFGMLDVGKPEAGQTVLVSGAAGATGSVAGQIAKIKGCRVVGIAGGERKCNWLTQDANFDAAIDYKSQKVRQRVRELCPDGVNVFFDNVGGETLEAALANLAMNGRIALCGAISRYNTTEAPTGPANYPMLIIQRGTMQGFIVLDYMKRAGEAIEELAGWVKAGRITYLEDIAEGFDNVPATLLRLYSGANYGKQLLRV